MHAYFPPVNNILFFLSIKKRRKHRQLKNFHQVNLSTTIFKLFLSRNCETQKTKKKRRGANHDSDCEHGDDDVAFAYTELMKCAAIDGAPFNPLRLSRRLSRFSRGPFFNSLINADSPRSLFNVVTENILNRDNAKGVGESSLFWSQKFKDFPGERERRAGKTIKLDVCTRGGSKREAKEKDIRARKNESRRADAEGPSTADKRDS